MGECSDWKPPNGRRPTVPLTPHAFPIPLLCSALWIAPQQTFASHKDSLWLTRMYWGGKGSDGRIHAPLWVTGNPCDSQRCTGATEHKKVVQKRHGSKRAALHPPQVWWFPVLKFNGVCVFPPDCETRCYFFIPTIPQWVFIAEQGFELMLSDSWSNIYPLCHIDS